ncbi:MAG: DNA-formamidopyrimidine glycosylase [Chloroflexi bacterium]|nr:DNA-formamidopyrimidine glycosylase [Chloroflexota bacterium]
MPELPEVETTVRDLKPHLVGRTIVRATIRWPRTIAAPRARQFCRDICGYAITDITRRAKYLRFHLQKDGSARSLFVHLRMTGGFRIDPCGTPRDKHMHVLFQLDDGRELRFRDTRKFGRMWLVQDEALVIGKLGPEPLEIGEKEFIALFDGKRRQLKPLLLDQTFLAGLGNIYVDESLWYARLHPLRAADSLTRGERVRLYHAIQRVLTRAIAVGGTSIDVMYRRVNGVSGGFQDSLRAFDREKRPCRRCGTPIVKTTVGQRGTHFCPSCQKPQ